MYNTTTDEQLQPLTKRQPGIAIWFKWLLLNILGGIIGLTLSFLLFVLLGLSVFWTKLTVPIPEEWKPVAGIIASSTPFSLLIGLCIGHSQLAALYDYLHTWKPLNWVQLSTAGSWLGFSATFLLVASVSQLAGHDSIVTPVISAMVGGTILGSLQYINLRNNLQNALGWIPANTIAWSTSGFAWYALEDVLLYKGGADPFLSADILLEICVLPVVLLAVFGAITGIALVWLLRTPLTAPSLQADEYRKS